MKKFYLLTVLVILAMLLVACGGDDDANDDSNSDNGDRQDTQSENSGGDTADNADNDGGSSGGGSVTDSGERALLALFSGEGEAFAAEFCEDVKADLDVFASALQGGPGTGMEQKVSCAEDGSDRIRCEYSVVMNDIETPSGTYAIAVKDGQLCGVPETAN